MAYMNLQVQNCPLGCESKINDLNKLNDNLDRLYNDCYIKVQEYQNAVKTLESQRAWYQNNQLAYEEKIRVLQRDLENPFNKWKESSKNLAKLIDNTMSVKSKLEEANDKTFIIQEHVRFVKEGGHVNAVPHHHWNFHAFLQTNLTLMNQIKSEYGKNVLCINKNVKGTRYDSSKTKTKVNPVKALAKWVWKPKQAVLEHVSKSSRASKVLTRYDYVDVYGRFKSVLAWDFQKH
ncbi:hypothetical protein Tco_0666773 [Tanacetum coccineum]